MNRMLYLLATVALFGGSAIPASVEACIIPSVTEIGAEYPPPKGMTDPAAIARWTAERVAFARAYEAVDAERQISQRRADLTAYAAEVEAMAKPVLAQELPFNLTRPLDAAFARRTDCGDVLNAPILDPAGYASLDELADIAIARGVFENSRDARYIPRRWARRSVAKPFPPCVIEARTAVSAHLARRFSRPELARALSSIRRNGFDRVPSDKVLADRRPGERQLLKFVTGRSGPLEFDRKAQPNSWQSGERAYAQFAREQSAELAEFFHSEEVAKGLIREMEAVLAQGTALCPQAAKLQDRFWEELDLVTQAEKHRILGNSPK